MHAFEHIDVFDLRTAIQLLSEPQTEALAGGTDLLGELKRRIRTTRRLINLKTIQELKGIGYEKGVRIGSLVTLSEIEHSPMVLKKYPMLGQAISVTATPQLRNMGTIGGNLCQHPRCWYYRSPLFHCWLKGGQKCFAFNGENRYHAILGSKICRAVHPSDLAPVMMALEATVKIQRSRKKGEIPLEDLYAQPAENRRQMTILGPADLILEIHIPAPKRESRGIYLKAMDRQAWSFALVSVAVSLSFDGSQIKKAHLVLGGVASMPWRAMEAEKLLQGQTLSRELAEEAATAALKSAQSLKDNKYKIHLGKGLILQALASLSHSS